MPGQIRSWAALGSVAVAVVLAGCGSKVKVPVPQTFEPDGTPIFASADRKTTLIWRNGVLQESPVRIMRGRNMPALDLTKLDPRPSSVTDPISGQKIEAQRTADRQIKLWRVSVPGRSAIATPPDMISRAAIIPGHSCFSCGCECYRHMDLIPVRGRLFVHVHGGMVQPHLLGLFELRHGDLIPVIPGKVENPIFSDDGCKLAYTLIKGRDYIAGVADMCKG